ncbi:MAG: glycosyltransferase [Flavobacteriales bacterium]|nr:glycosyltransferase [Flavobacteriales bacterium]
MRPLILINKLTKSLQFTYGEIVFLVKHHNAEVACFDLDIDDTIDRSKIHLLTPPSLIKQKQSNFLARHNLAINYKSSSIKKALEKLIDQVKPDVIQCHFGNVALQFLDNIDRKTPLPIVINFHGYDASAWLKNSSYRNRYAKLQKNFNTNIITCSDDMYKRLSDNGIKGNTHLTNYYGTDTIFFKRTNYKTPERFELLQICTLRTKKGILDSLKAFHLFKQNNPNIPAHFTIGGSGGLRSEIETLIQTLGINQHVTLAGVLTRDQCRTYLNKSSAFIHPSKTPADGDMEGIPNAIMEAMSMELPIISTYHSGIPELITSGEHGFLAEEGNVTQISEGIAKAVDCGYLEINRNRIKNNFELNDHNERVLHYFKTLVS